ncbi:NAD(P)-dependent dehydrogenase (short-subunit alcohol dehydrogenase family) [Caballeronia udeis]|jgi:NAD(P)-dependent dehydrogenase (short-subunit alcohol dehydrogenase family)|uniref:NAD(P)-dependent dehydrogenase (Short-subunit alcohol dehydrogenase family) n=1 Tax=Caballeronia udeis TaxID=1232866 RepID=A0ABW8MKU1_9BURK
MKIVVIGGTGTIGRAIVEEMQPRHDIVVVGQSRGDRQVDITDAASVQALFDHVGRFDALIAATGNLHLGPVAETTAEQFNLGLQDKLLGQIRVALAVQHHLNDGGSITLTSGIVAEEPIRQGSNATTVNAAVEGFVRAAAIELARGLRINAVSPTLVTESASVYGPFFPGFESVPVAKVALAYRRSVEGAQTGRVYRIW